MKCSDETAVDVQRCKVQDHWSHVRARCYGAELIRFESELLSTGGVALKQAASRVF